MRFRNFIQKISAVGWIIIIAASVKFALQVYIAPGYGYFLDELYTIAMSRHLAFGYVDLPPLVPLLVAASRAILGESLVAIHIFPALAGAVKVIFICLITRELGGKWFAILLTALSVIAVPVWLSLDSIFCYDSIDQMVLSIFLYTLVRLIKTDNPRLWISLGIIAGIACMTKMTMLFMGPGFLAALLFSKHRRDLQTRWPWLGAAICVVIVSPYVFWQMQNNWPTLEYWTRYGDLRVYQATLPQYLINILIYMNPLLLPLWIAGLYRLFRRLSGVSYAFLGFLFFFTLILEFSLHATPRLFVQLFMPVIAAGSVALEEILEKLHWKAIPQVLSAAYLVWAAILVIPASLPILPVDRLPEISERSKGWFGLMREFNGGNSNSPLILTGRLGWEELTQEVAGVYNNLPEEDRAIAGIYADFYARAGAIDLYGPQYGLPHAVSGSLTYYLWGPGYSWDVMILIVSKTNDMGMFFEKCELKAVVDDGPDRSIIGQPHIFVCRNPKVSADMIWTSSKSYR